MATITVKVIKPKKMNQRAFDSVLLKALASTEKGILKDFTDTTATWKHKPEFRHGHTLNTTRGTAYTDTQDEIYGYVNDGTRPHPITPKGPWALKFRGGKGSYRAKTAPRRFGSRPGGPSGPVVYRRSVQHPGTKAREFDKIIAKRWKTLLPRAMRSALDKEAKASGHGIP